MYCDETADYEVFTRKYSEMSYLLVRKFDGEVRIDRTQTKVGWFSTFFAALYLGNGARLSIGHS